MNNLTFEEALELHNRLDKKLKSNNNDSKKSTTGMIFCNEKRELEYCCTSSAEEWFKLQMQKMYCIEGG